MKLTFTIFRKKSRYVIEQAMSKCYILIGIFQDIVEGSEGYVHANLFFVLTTIHLSNATPDRCNNLCIEGGQSCRQYTSRTIIVRKSLLTYNIIYA